MVQVTCARCERAGEQLPHPPLGGERGRTIQQNVCSDCWSEWMQESANLINHYGLQVAVPADRQQLYVVMAEFLKLPGIAPSQALRSVGLVDPTKEGVPPTNQ